MVNGNSSRGKHDGTYLSFVLSTTSKCSLLCVHFYYGRDLSAISSDQKLDFQLHRYLCRTLLQSFTSMYKEPSRKKPFANKRRSDLSAGSLSLLVSQLWTKTFKEPAAFDLPVSLGSCSSALRRKKGIELLDVPLLKTSVLDKTVSFCRRISVRKAARRLLKRLIDISERERAAMR